MKNINLIMKKMMILLKCVFELECFYEILQQGLEWKKFRKGGWK